MTPLDIKSRASMRKTMKLQPQLQALQKKYANDKEKLNAKTAELYKKAHVNPLSSCLPMLLTWPILIAVFGAMRTASNHEMLTQVGQILNGETVDVNDTTTYDNHKIVVPSFLCEPVFADVNNYVELLIDSGYYQASDVQ